jgi:protein-S-isoprenylcysteine O-methyltransferase Ste14
VNVVQWIAFAVLLVGLAWLGLQVLADNTRVTIADPPEVGGYRMPDLLAGGGFAVGVVLAVLSRIAGWATARFRARKAERSLTEAIEEVADQRVIGPVEAELGAYAQFRTNILRARD